MPLTPTEFDALVTLISQLSEVDRAINEHWTDGTYVRARRNERDEYIAAAREVLVKDDAQECN